MDFYNEIEPYAAQWLESLIAAGHLPGGKVDRRSIRDITAEELKGWDRAHFFAGIGGWPLALRIAGWPATKPVWTGSCPCQSFSAAGAQAGLADDRNLWPPWFDQIKERRPDTIFGEQVSNAIGFGWLDGISADLEREGYTVGSVVLGAHSVGAPHIRKRLYWVAYSEHAIGWSEFQEDGNAYRGNGFGRGGEFSGLGDSDDARPQGREFGGNSAGERTAGTAGLGNSEAGRLGNTDGTGFEEQRKHDENGTDIDGSGQNFWSDYDLVPCADGKSRRVEPGTFPLASGVPARVGKLRAYGNAICVQTAVAFIRAFMEFENG